VHAVEELQDTPSRRVSVAPLGLGTDLTDHSVPFQLSANETYFPELLTAYPAASHDVEELHDTPTSLFVAKPDGLGVDCTAHGSVVVSKL